MSIWQPTDIERRAGELLDKKLVDEGRLIEAGWAMLRALWLPPDAPEEQVKDLRWAFMAGAQHLFGSIMNVLDPGAEPTRDDFRRMDCIDSELGAFAQEMLGELTPNAIAIMRQQKREQTRQ
jgi:hypothetical protein